MTSSKPTFRVMKNGYDRFAVDDAIEKYAAQTEELERRVLLYQNQLAEAEKRLQELQVQYRSLESTSDAERQAAENIARLSLREANEIISTAQQNADLIVHQALVTAREILTELSRLYNDADSVKGITREKLLALIRELDEFQLPKMPDLSWLIEAEKRMR
ncbi:MAG: DivIVA domain-containing protein [Solobacterium sp.]|nr:DivIVA domain-containing protein [Solobacterium sp.]MBQ6221102.1 DivIVA domain-containing protein [Solobacterium sp.]MBR2668357.1 DivIVA domain-containing protein [Solobacterium sp.]